MRPPDLTVGPLANPYMLRWVLWRWRGWQLALHKICRSDDDRALHDHVGRNYSFVLWGAGYREVFSHTWEPEYARHVHLWSFAKRDAEVPHRLELHFGPVWTLWLRAPKIREWGFWCKRGWIHNSIYIGSSDYYGDGVSTVSKGCDE